jgi:hypothetical protein
MDAKETTIAQMEHDHGSHSGDSEEKGVTPANAYPINDDDYEVTFKTWIVVAILASAYGVRFPTVRLNNGDLQNSRFLSGLSLLSLSSTLALRPNSEIPKPGFGTRLCIRFAMPLPL